MSAKKAKPAPAPAQAAAPAAGLSALPPAIAELAATLGVFHDAAVITRDRWQGGGVELLLANDRFTELTGYDRVLQMARDIPGLGQPLGQDCQVLGAEILYAARKEMALKLSDALIRRTEAGTAGHPGADAVERAAAIMAHAHEWDEWRTRTEIGEVEAFFKLPRE